MWSQLLSFFFAAQTVAGAGTFLFDDGPLVTELHTPLDFYTYVDQLRNTTTNDNTCREASRFILLYSSWCPHCHAFAPEWESLASRLQCDKNHLELAAFECVVKDDDRSIKVDDWKLQLPSNISSQLEDSSHIVPFDICQTVLTRAYPTLLLVTKNQCELKAPWKPVESTTKGQLNWRAFFGDDGLAMYHVSVDMRATPADNIMDVLTTSGIADDCNETLSTDRVDRRIATYLRDLAEDRAEGFESTAATRRERWNDRALDVSPPKRFHDAILGIYHILNAWVPHEIGHWSPQQYHALSNLLLLVSASLPATEDRKKVADLLTGIRTIGYGQLTAQNYLQLVNQSNFTLAGIPIPEKPEQPELYTKLCDTSACTVWTLFHLIGSLQVLYERSYKQFIPNTVLCWELFGIAQEKDAALDESLKQNATELSLGCFRGSDIAEVMHQLIWGYFGCQDCREHFHAGYMNCAGERCDWITEDAKELSTVIKKRSRGVTPRPGSLSSRLAYSLWLWRFHNIVNVRTATDRVLRDLRKQAESPEGLKAKNFTMLYKDEDVRLPSAMMCPECHIGSEKITVIDEKWMLSFLDANKDESKMIYDHHEDFNLLMVAEYLQAFFIRRNWLGSKGPTYLEEKSDDGTTTTLRLGGVKSMTWDNEQEKFQLVDEMWPTNGGGH